MTEAVAVSFEGAVARIKLDRPPLNILSIAELDRLTDAADRVRDNADARVVRLEAGGKVFCAGVDVQDHIGDKVPAMMEALNRLFEAFERITIPTVSVVHGAALGGGCELTLATDLCFASDRASFGQPEIRLGLFAPPASVLLPRLLGERRALGLLLTGETLSASDAERVGLVNRVFEHDCLDEGVSAALDALAALSGAALRQAKRAVRVARGLPCADAHRAVHRLYLEELMRTSDAHEGLRAFLEKRSPVWKHL